MEEDKIKNILQLIKNDKSFENHFFNKLATSSKPLEWLFPLKETGYFAPQNNPTPQEVQHKKGYYTVPHWNILDALDNMAAKNAENPDDEISRKLVEIADGIIDYRDDNGERIDNYRTDWKLLETISRLPIEYISSRHIGFIKDALRPKIGSALLDSEIGKLFLPKLIKGESVELIIELLDVILHYVKSNKKYSDKYLPVMDSHWLKNALEKNKAGIAKLCSIEAVKVALSKIESILEEDKSQFNYVWIPAIEDHPQTSFPDKYECLLVYFVRDMLESSNPSDIKTAVDKMIHTEHDILNRLSYHTINHHYDELKHLFWSLPKNPLNSLTIHEIFELLKKHSQNFTDDELRTVLHWIETQELHMTEDIAEDGERAKKYIARYQKEWLLALLDSKHPNVIKKFEECNEIFPHEIEHPGFHYWSQTGWVKEVGPIEEDKLHKMTNEQIAEFIAGYKEDIESDWRGLERVDLESSIRNFVSNNPERFSSELFPFLTLPRKYQHALLRGLEEAWRKNRDFDWTHILEFMLKVLKDDAFWKEKPDKDAYDYNDWILGTIADLIQDGTKSDKHAFAAELFPLAEKILLILLEETTSNMKMMSDLATSVLNSTRGKVFMAAVNFSLRCARQSDKGENERWIQSIEDDFTKRLDRNYEPSLEYSVILGEYLVNFLYLDKSWVHNNINSIFLKDDDEHWEAAFTGNIALSATVYEEVYKLLYENGHYEKGLSFSFKDEHTESKLVQHIVIGYLAGWDDLSNNEGLISRLFKHGKVSHLSELASFMWAFRDKDDKDISAKVRPLWKILIEIIQPNLDKDEYRSIASDLSKWLTLVDTFDGEVYKWLKISLSAMDEVWDSYYLVEYLRKYVEQSPELVAKTYLDMLILNIYPDYKKEDIVAIVKSLYHKGYSEHANRICNLYGSKGFETLRETFEEHNKS